MPKLSLTNPLIVGACIALAAILIGCPSSGPGPGSHPVSGVANLGVNVGTGNYGGQSVDLTQSSPPTQSDTQMEMFSSMATTENELTSQFSQKLGVDVAGERGVFSGSSDFQHRREQLNSRTEVSFKGEVSVRVGYQKVMYTPKYMLSQDASLAKDVMELPLSADGSNLAKIIDFYNRRGTHRLSTVNLGGELYLEFHASMDTMSATSKTLTSFRLGAEASFQKMAKVPMAMNGSVTASQEDLQTFSTFTASSSKHIKTRGGDPTKTTFDAWLPTVKDSQVPISQEFRGWEDVVIEVGKSKGLPGSDVTGRMFALRKGLKLYLESCPNACSDHGLCDFDHKQCLCDADYFGDACDQRHCPQSCDHGACDTSKGTCTCDDGFKHANPIDPTSPCQDCHNKKFDGGTICDYDGTTVGKPAIANPIYAGNYTYPCMPVGAFTSSDDPKIAADIYCKFMLNDEGAESIGYETQNPLCWWTTVLPLNAGWCVGFRIGNGQKVEPSHYWVTEPAHEDIFASITCKRCGDADAAIVIGPQPSRGGSMGNSTNWNRSLHEQALVV